MSTTTLSSSLSHDLRTSSSSSTSSTAYSFPVHYCIDRDAFPNDERFSEVLAALRFNTETRSLTLEKCRMGRIYAEILARGLRENSTITSLNLNWNNLQSDGLIALLSIFIGFGDDYNGFRNGGSGDGVEVRGDGEDAAALVGEINAVSEYNTWAGCGTNSYSNNTPITSSGSIKGLRGDKSPLKSGKSKQQSLLSECKSRIKYLELKNNEIDDIGVHHLASVLKEVDHCIDTIDLRWNRIGNEGAAALLKLCKSEGNVRLRILLQGNRLDSKTLAMFDSLNSSAIDFDENNLIRRDKESNYKSNSNSPSKVSNNADDGSCEETSNAELRFRNDLLHKEIMELRLAVSSRSNEKLILDAQLEASCARNVELEQQLSQSQFYCLQQQDTLAELNRKNLTIADSKTTIIKNAELESIRIKDMLNSQIDNQKLEIDNLNLKIINLNSKVETVVNENSILRSEITKFEVQRDEERRVNQQKTSDDNQFRVNSMLHEMTLKADNTSLKSELSAALDRLQNLESNNVQMSENYLRDIKNDRLRFESDIKNLTDDYTTQLTSLKLLLKESKDEVVNLTSSLHKQSYSHEILIAEMQKVCNDEVSKAVATEKSVYESAVDELRKRCDLLTLSANSSEARNAEVNLKLANIVQVNKSSEEKTASFINSLKVDLKLARESHSTLNENFKALAIENFNNLRESERKDKVISDLDSKVRKVLLEQETLKAKLQELLDLNSSLEQRMFAERQERYHLLGQVKKKLIQSVSSEFEFPAGK